MFSAVFIYFTIQFCSKGFHPYVAVQDFKMPASTWVLLPSWGWSRLHAHSLALLNVITLFLIQVSVSSCDLLVVSIGQMSMSRAINITQKLWTAGITAEIMYDWSQVKRHSEWNATNHSFHEESSSTTLGSQTLLWGSYIRFWLQQ